MTAVQPSKAIKPVPYRTHEEAVEIARELSPRFHERVWESEKLRHVPDENMDELVESGLIHLYTPVEWGGGGLTNDSLIEVSSIIAQGCCSTGWVYELLAAHLFYVCQFPVNVQEQVLTDPRPIVTTSVNSIGTLDPVDGGYILKAEGSFSSGVDHSTWLLVKLNDAKLHPDQPAEPCWFLIPRSDYDVVDNWHTIGLRGTGSKAISVKGAFVPHERVLTTKVMDEGKTGMDLYKSSSPLFRGASDIVVRIGTPGPELGMAQAMVKTFEERCRKAAAAGVEQTPALLRLAKAAAEVDSARALLMENARLYGHMPADKVNDLDRVKFRSDGAYCGQLCRNAVNSLFEASGSASVYEGNEFSRIWRDSNAAAQHLGLRWDVHSLVTVKVMLEQ